MIRPCTRRVGLIGFGAIGTTLAQSLLKGANPPRLGALHRRPPPSHSSQLNHFSSIDDLLAWRPDLVVECAGHAAVRDLVPGVLSAGVPVVIASVGALADERVQIRIDEAARSGGAAATIVSGAVGGLDVLRAARMAGLQRVAYAGRKPPSAWAGTPTADRFNLERIECPLCIFNGSAREAARSYPQNANVAAAIALAGTGFDQTEVSLFADPAAARNTHILSAEGAFGRMRIEIENTALPGNPRSSWLAALSLEAAVNRHFAALDC